MNILIPIVGLLVLILIHELGHFLVAKAVGARATRFSIGFPPAIVRVKKGDTEYCIGAIPLGGYVRIPGMTRPQGSDAWRLGEAVEEARLRREHGRDDVLGDAVTDLRAALDRGDLDAVGRLASIARTALDTDADLLDPTTLRVARKDVERLDEEAHAGAYWRLAVWRRIAVVAAGPLANIAAAVLILTAFYLGGVPILDVSKKIEAVSSSSPAAAAGLHSDDRVVSVNGVQIASAADVSPAIQKTAGGPVTLVVQRGNREVTLAPATPELKDGRWLLGFQLGTERVGTRTYDVAGAVDESVDRLVEATRGTLASFKDIVISDGRKDLTTPVGIVSQSSETVDEGYFPFVLAMISLALAILNLLPFLPLDGGHILFALIERFRGGRPVPRSLVERASAVGIVLVLVLFAFGVTNDIDRLSAP